MKFSIIDRMDPNSIIQRNEIRNKLIQKNWIYDEENPDSYYNVEERSFGDAIRNGNSPVQLISNALTNVSRIKYLHTRPKDGKLITETKRIYNVD